jgi:epoxyqueuosine reductase QueG
LSSALPPANVKSCRLTILPTYLKTWMNVSGPGMTFDCLARSCCPAINVGRIDLEHPVLTRIRREGFAALGWFEPSPEDHVPFDARFVILIGNAGPDMFRRFSSERDPDLHKMDDWTRTVIDPLANDLEAKAVYPFDNPPHPFLTWAKRGGAGHASPLGLNIHPIYGLWHAYRAALFFPFAFDLPKHDAGSHPCESCSDRPCLDACPVSAFDGKYYDVIACGQHIATSLGIDCMTSGCKARLACPVGQGFTYPQKQIHFHMRAFHNARHGGLN